MPLLQITRTDGYLDIHVLYVQYVYMYCISLFFENYNSSQLKENMADSCESRFSAQMVFVDWYYHDDEASSGLAALQLRKLYYIRDSSSTPAFGFCSFNIHIHTTRSLAVAFYFLMTSVFLFFVCFAGVSIVQPSLCSLIISHSLFVLLAHVVRSSCVFQLGIVSKYKRYHTRLP